MNVDVQSTFGAADYAVLIIVLVISSGIGIYYRFTGGKQKTTQEYLLADRNMSITPVAFSLMASFMSAITLQGVSTENYSYGTQFVIINLSYGLSTPIAAYLYLPVFFRLQATSAYEYLEKRFGQTTRLTASLVYTLQMVLYMGIVLYAPALALETLTGISKEAAILAIGLVCTFYSGIGGMKAVLITDVFQSLLMFTAVFSVIICAAIQAGGLDEIWKIAESGGRIEFFNFQLDPTVRHTWWSLIIGGSVIYLSLYAVNQTQVQRYLTVRDLKAAQKALWVNWPILTLLSLSTSFSGLAIYSKYFDCDPVKSGRITSSDQLMPLYVLDTMGHIPGISGLFVAGIFSASLSTVSAALNSLAAVTLEDYLKPIYKKIYKKPLSEIKSSWQSKLLAFFYGFVCLGIAFSAQLLGGVLQASLTIFGVVGGPLLGLFTLGMFTTTANEKGSLIGLASGFAISLWLGFGGPKPPPPYLPVSIEGCNKTYDYKNLLSHMQANILHVSTFMSNETLAEALVQNPNEESEYFWPYRLSYLWYSVIGFIVTLIIGSITSFIINKTYPNSNKTDVDPNLFIPPISNAMIREQGRRLSIGSQNSNNEENYDKEQHIPNQKNMITNL